MPMVPPPNEARPHHPRNHTLRIDPEIGDHHLLPGPDQDAAVVVEEEAV